MDLLLDTHALLWFLAGDPKLSTSARAAITDLSNDARVSVASLWEVAIKFSIGKLLLTGGVSRLLEQAFIESGFERLPIEPEHLVEVAALPFKQKPGGADHRDPFDRLLIAQARADRRTLVTNETWWQAAYGVDVLWE